MLSDVLEPATAPASQVSTPKAIIAPPGPSATANKGPRVAWLLVAGATIVAAALRLPFLGHQSLWLDEIYTRDIVRESSLSGVWNQIEATESTPPLYYVLCWLVHARSTVAMRLIPALALVAAVPVGYLAFRRFIGWRAAVATAALLAVNPLLVSYATDARSYGLFVLTTLVSVWAFSTLIEDGSRRRFGLWTLASIACVWTHYFGIFVVGGELAALIVLRPDLRRVSIGWAAVLGVCLIPLVPLVANQSGDERAGFIAGIPLSKRVSETVRQFAMGANVPRAWLEAAGLLVVLLCVLAGIVIVVRSRRPGPRALLVIAAITLGVPLLLAVLRIEDRFYARNVIAAVPLISALAAPVMLRLRATPLVLYVVFAALASVWVATNWRYEQTDWKAAVAQAESVDRSVPILAVTTESAPVVQAYLGHSPATAGITTQRVWIIVEPIRAAGHRALGPAPVPNLPGFATLRTIQVQGFVLALLSAATPTHLVAIPGSSLFAGATSTG
jgi:4-amino-4-deoxy-L-arabinose transferase-like glycosyltransferase